MTTPVPKSIVAKLSEIMGLLGNVEKKGFNKAQNYRFVRESDVVAALVPLLAERKLILHTTITSHTREELYRTQSGMTMWMTTIYVDGTWIDGETGESTPVGTFVGTGADTGDKGVYKAMTGAEKYFLMKGFLISTGDDPEADEKVDKTAAAGAAAKGTKVVRGNQPGVQRGGKSSQATTAQVSEIARLAKELHLDAEGIVPVIRRIIGSEPDEGQSLREWLGAMTSDEASSIVLALSTAVDSVDGTIEEVVNSPSTEDVEEEVPEELPIS